MTDTNEKIRSLFLTALMVFSVFAGTIAFSGGAAAAGANVGIEQAVEYSANSGPTSTVELALNDTADSVDSVTVFIDGDKNPSKYVTTNNNGEVQNYRLSTNKQRITLDLTQDVQPSRNLTVKVGVSKGTASSNLVAEDIDVTSTTITTDGTKDSNNINVFRGEVIAVEDTAADGHSIEVENNNGGVVSADNYPTDSQVYTVDTSDLDTGQAYNISVDNKEEESFTVSDLSLNVNIDTDVGDGANIDDTDNLAVNVSTNRGGQFANATLYNADDDQVAESALNGPNNPQFKKLKGNDNVVFNFKNVSADDSPYYVTVTDNQTGITAESDQINVSESDDGEASFETSTVQDEVGDVTNITVQVDNTEDAVINVGSQNDDNYVIQGQLEDDNGDGEVTVQFNSYTAGTSTNGYDLNGDGDNADTNVNYDESTLGFDADGNGNVGDSGTIDESAVEAGGNTVLSVPGDDDIDVTVEKGSFAGDRNLLSDDSLEAGSYSINVTAGTSPDVTSPDSVGTLRLNENSVEGVQTWAAPSDADITDDDVDIYDRIGVNLTQSDDVAAEDVVVHEIEASGVEGAVEYEQEDNSAGSTTKAFLDAVDADGDTSNGVKDAGLTLYVNRTDVGANADADVLQLNSTNVDVVDDSDNNTYFVAVDTTDVTFTNSGKDLIDEEDTSINATFAIKDSSPVSDDSASASALYTTSERNADLNLDDDGLVTVSAAAGQEVTGTTNVAPGSELEVEMESENDANPFVIRPETNVATDGTYTATADFSDYSAGTNFTVETLDVDGGTQFSDEEDGRIVEAGTATVSISEQESTGSEVVVDSAQLSDGGFIAIHAGNASGDVVGNSDYLEAGGHEDVTITLDEPMDEDFTAVAMPHQDTNGNEAYDFPDADGPYTSNGTAVTDSANVTIVEEQTEAPDTETETEAPDTETETEEQTEETTTMDSGTDEVETTEQTGPGFTAALALIALVAAALLAVRRDN
ncbi:BGTF surface domain-containing protein [Haloarcula japonica]|uniref:DUF7282 domain-containing protein n=1 Tax=Haloarcula japonica TaxID=29282 RepID=UPI0039F684F7